MKKSDLIIKFSEKNNITVKDAERVLEIIINEITAALSKGNRAEFRGLESLTLQSDWLEQLGTLEQEKLLKFPPLLYQLLGWQKNF